ncbi:fetuin B [Genypterus blacodes]|uniref:fetuin B n=1 Tax=Genypterus blacodes TaxID=154954 RepID=UPI003F763C6D
MKFCVLSLLLVAGCVYAAPVEQGGMQPGSCTDALALGAANEALNKINLDRKTGYVLKMHRLSNVNLMIHEETGQVFYLTMEVVETNCHVLSKKAAADCMARRTSDTPVYGECRAIIYMNRPQRVVRLYKYDCAIRPVPSAKVAAICPDCPARMRVDNIPMVDAAHEALKKFNKEGGMSKLFQINNVTRARAQMGIAVFYNTEFVIDETVCDKTKDLDKDECPNMQCEFAHKGFCKGSTHVARDGEHHVTVDCEIYEPEPAEREKKLHLVGGESDHSHSNPQPLDRSLAHDHAHNHAKSHAYSDTPDMHANDSEHHHTHDHGHDSAHKHGHDHSHEHGHGHDHVHAHHTKAHDHTGDTPNQHHNYSHDATSNTHDHDHELALDHEHAHAHLHDHEHHHHHHDHEHETSLHDHPEGRVRMLPPVDEPQTLQAVLDILAGPGEAVTLPVHPDPEIPGKTEPTILAFPSAVSAECPAPLPGTTLVEKLFAEAS